MTPLRARCPLPDSIIEVMIDPAAVEDGRVRLTDYQALWLLADLAAILRDRPERPILPQTGRFGEG